jgi:hypothetical protein
MSLAGRKVLIDYSLNSTLIYLIFLFRFHKTFNGKLVKIQRRFFWDGGSSLRKYNLVKWNYLVDLKRKEVWV